MNHLKKLKPKKRRVRRDQEHGFTVIEIIVIVAIIGVLTAVTIVRFISTQDEKAKSTAEQMMGDIAYAQEMAIANTKGTVIGINGGGGGEGGGGGCFVATVCYGERSQQVAALQGFRDQVLQKYSPGRAFVRWYYRDGPALAEVVKANPTLRTCVRAVLLPLALLTSPFADKAYAFGGGGGGGGGGGEDFSDPNTYAIRFQDATWINNPRTGENFVVPMATGVSITSADFTLEFDSSGKLDTPSYSWSSAESSVVCCQFNEEINVRIARYTGKTWIE